MRILSYINQFFGQIGGEDMAGHAMEVREGLVGPAMGLNALLKDGNEIVATVICGDNYAAENEENFTEQLKKIIKDYDIEMVIAGPAFNAGRYGMACGMACKTAYEMEIPAVSGMFEENPGLDIYKRFGFIFPTANNAGGMRKALPLMASFANKIARGEDVYKQAEEGYFKRGIRHYFFTERTGAERVVDMAVAKATGVKFTTELEMPKFSRVPIAAPIEDLSKAKIAILTTCGPVPVGNPDHIEAHAATKWKIYHIDDFGGSDMKKVEIAHGGYSPMAATNNGNRVVPVDAALALEKENYIGELCKDIYVTVGNSMPLERAAGFGAEIAQSLISKGISGAILTSA